MRVYHRVFQTTKKMVSSSNNEINNSLHLDQLKVEGLLHLALFLKPTQHKLQKYTTIFQKTTFSVLKLF